MLLMAGALLSYGQYYNPDVAPPAPVYPPPTPTTDTVMMPFPVQQTVPQSYEDLMADEFAADLSTPSNITTHVEFDPATGCYIIRTKLGEFDIATPFMLSASEYDNWQLRKSMQEYYRKRNSELVTEKEKQPFNIFDMNFALGPLEKIFGPAECSCAPRDRCRCRWA